MCSKLQPLTDTGYRWTAPCSRASAARIASKLCCTSASVSVRSADWNVKRTDRLTARPGRPCPDTDRKSDGDQRRTAPRAVARMVPRMISAGKEFSDDDREVADDERIPRQRLRRVATERSRGTLRARRGRARRPRRVLPRQFAAVGNGRRQPPDDADRVAVVGRRDHDAAPGPHRNGSPRRRRRRIDTERVTQLLDDALDVEEVDVARGAGPVLGGAAPVHGAATTPRLSSGREPRADFEEPHVGSTVPPVVRDRVDQARQQRWPQHVELRRQRVGDRDDRRRRRPRRTAPRPRASMNPNVTASERPAAVSTRRTVDLASIARIRRRRRAARRPGNVGVRRSNP